MNDTRFKRRRSKWKAGISWLGLILFGIVIIVLPFIRVEDVKVFDNASVIVGYYIFVSLLFVIATIVLIFSRGHIE
jgi:hypothetical protein